MRRKRLSKSEIKRLNESLKFDFVFNKKDSIDLIDLGDNIYYLYNNKPAIVLIKSRNLLFPTLDFIIKNNIELPFIKIDMKAIPFLMNGADIMRPGILEFSEFNKNEIVIVKDIEHSKSLCVALSLENSQNLKNLKKGKALLNLHYIGDKIWKFNEGGLK